MTDEEIKARADDDAELSRIQRDKDFADVLSTPGGRRFVYRLIFDVAGLMNGSFGTVEAMAYGEGGRAVGRAIVADAKRVAPDRYVTMIQEAVADGARREAERQARLVERLSD